MRKMKKVMVGFVSVCLVASLCACNSDKDKTDVKVSKTDTIEVSTEVTEKPEITTTETVTTQAQVSEETQTNKTTESAKAEETTTESAKAEETTTESVIGGGEVEETTASEVSTPGPDVAELVNLRGDETTVYKLVDGTYMDRIDRRFTFDGVETWVDEDGVAWNEVVK